MLCKGKLGGARRDQSIFLEDIEVPLIPPFQEDHLDIVWDVVKDFTAQKIVSHLIVSQETDEEVKPQFQKFRQEVLIVEKWDISMETANFFLELPSWSQVLTNQSRETG